MRPRPWTFGLGHNQHAHPRQPAAPAARAASPTPADAPQHGETENIFGVVGITYTDNGRGGVPPAAGDAQVILNPKLQQAERARRAQGVDDHATTTTASGLRKVTSFDAGDWIAYDPVNLRRHHRGQDPGHGRRHPVAALGLADAAPFAHRRGDRRRLTRLADRHHRAGQGPPGTGERLYVTSTGGVVLDSLTFQGDGVADETAPTVTRPRSTRRRRTVTNGWYTSNVIAHRRRRPTTARSPAASTPSTAGPRGSRPTRRCHPVQRGRDDRPLPSHRQRRQRLGGRLAHRTDRPDGPAVTATGVDADGVYGDSKRPVPVFSATDAVSGGATVTATVDGKAVNSGQALELWRLPLGNHDLTVKARDKAGNITTKTVALHHPYLLRGHPRADHPAAGRRPDHGAGTAAAHRTARAGRGTRRRGPHQSGRVGTGVVRRLHGRQGPGAGRSGGRALARDARALKGGATG